jgi:hypothetical protein
MAEILGEDTNINAWMDSSTGHAVRRLMRAVHDEDFPITLPDEQPVYTLSDEAMTMRAILNATHEVMPPRA